MNQDLLPISVVMPVYNTPADLLAEATESILNQSFTEFEFIIIDDCSDNKKTIGYLNTIDDERVRIINNPENYGITKTLNIGMKLSKGKYIARMDSDDIALPQRFEKQYTYLESHPEVIICGSYVRFFGDKNGIWGARTDDQEMYRIRLLFGNAGPSHPSVMYRREKMLEFDLWYDEELRYAQDYMMWVNASRVGTIACMDEILLLYRFHKGQVSTDKAEVQKIMASRVREKQLKYLFEDVTSRDAENHWNYYYDKSINNDSCKWFRKLIAENDRKGIYDRKKFRMFVTDLMVKKVYATFDIKWKDPRSYIILFRFLPVACVMKEFRKKAAEKLRMYR